MRVALALTNDTQKASPILTPFAILSLGASFALVACSSDDDSSGGTAGDAGSSYGGAAHAGSTGSAGAQSTPPGGSADAGSGAGGGAQTGDAGSAGALDAAGAAGADSNSGEVAYVADLEGFSQNPRIVTTATGSATLSLSADKKTLSYHIKQTVTNATGEPHSSGCGRRKRRRGVMPLEPLSADMSGSIELTSATDLAGQPGQPTKFHINVHSALDTDGEIRGQILHPDETLYVASH